MKYDELIKAGRRIFPVKHKSKKPLIDGWKEFALNQEDMQPYEDLNIGMLVGLHSGVLTIDLDFKHPEAEKFYLDYMTELSTGIVVSTGGGKHFHFEHPYIKTQAKVYSAIGGIRRGVDLLCDTKTDDGARYVLIPDSIHPNGDPYSYDIDSGMVTLEDKLPLLPDILLDIINDRTKWANKNEGAGNEWVTLDPAQWYAENPHMLFNVDPFDSEPITEGNRNNDMAKIAGKLLYMNDNNSNYILEDLKTDMYEVNELRCTPMLDIAEVDALCESIFKVKAKKDAKLEKEKEKSQPLEFDLGELITDKTANNKKAGVAFTSGLLPEPKDKPNFKESINDAALYILYQPPFKPVDASGHSLIFLESDFYLKHENVWRYVSEQYITSIIQSYYLGATKPSVSNMINFMKNYLYYPVKNIPFWRDGVVPTGYPIDPRKIIPFENGLLDIEQYLKTNDMASALKPHSAQLFNTVKLPFNFDATAKCPEWEGFLASIWGSATCDKSEALREWSGHMMIPDISQQKIAILHGASRGGKGTIGRILHKLIGHENSVATNLHTLLNEHGLSGLVGKTMAIMYDAHVPARANGEKAIEILKSISGGDPQTINRKFHDPYTIQLTTRIMIFCNEIPKLHDTNDALINRLIPFKFTKSFYGKERHDLEHALAKELEGIAIWAIKGIQNYMTRGKLLFPREATVDIQDLKRILNPLTSFVDDNVVFPTADPNDEICVAELYNAYIAWSDENYVNFKYTKDRLLAKVKNICPEIRTVRRNGLIYWKGIRLRKEEQTQQQVNNNNLF